MFLRVNRVVQNDRAYQYVHLVESYRRPEDGRPAHRVIKALGKLSEAEIESWRTALRALSQGQRVVVAPEAAVEVRPEAPLANLRYLDAAVLLEMFQGWGLDTLCDALLGTGEPDASVTPGAVVAALTIQRCLEAGSKAFGARWIPRTALPELLGVAPSVFNNTRLHRVLDGLSEVGEALQAALARRYRERDGQFVSLFLDTTEAVFEGIGPELAQKNLTKQGVVRRRICIPLLCNERGYPVRWDVLPGKAADCNVFIEACEALSSVSWARGVPVVLDRAAGTTEVISHLLGTGLHFLTALVSSEKPAYAPGLAGEALDDIAVDDATTAIGEARSRVERAGMLLVQDDLLVQDLGVVERSATVRRPDSCTSLAAAEPDTRCRSALQVARELHDAVQQRVHRSQNQAARARGLGTSVARKYSTLLKLVPDLQEAVLRGEADGVTLDALVRIAKLPPAQQQSAFAALRRSPPTAAPASTPDNRTIRVRAVAYFNPEIFVDKRRAAQQVLERVRTEVAALNRRLARSPGRWSRDSAAAAADRILRPRRLLGAFTITLRAMTEGESRYLKLELVLDEREWARRRRYDGFTILVAHPDIKKNAAELCALYRGREMVEHDFRVIKSLVELHPVRHRLDHKVKAHVTVCMLALLLERTLRHKLGNHGTSERALEELGGCYLNYFDKQRYALTKPTDEQRRLVEVLQLPHLLDDAEVTHRLTPR